MPFPTSLDSFTANVDNVDVIYASDINELQTAIEALEAKVGVDSSVVNTSHEFKLNEVTGGDEAVGKTATQTLTNKTLTSPVVNVGSDATGDMYYRNAGVLTRIPAGTDNQIMKLNGTTPNWETETVTVNASTTVAGIVEEATQSETDNGTTIGATGARLFVNPSSIRPINGGDGSDGALTVSSGTTNIDLGSSAFFVKNYSSISITGTGKVTFTNPHANGTIIILKSKGDVTLTSSQAPMIDASVLGANGGAGVSCIASASASGNTGNSGLSLLLSNAGGAGATAGSVGAGGTATTLLYSGSSFTSTKQKYALLSVASGGGSGGVTSPGGGGTSTSYIGGRGGGTLVIECAGAWNFTTASGISVAGGSPASGTTSGAGGAGGSGGGGGGYFLGIYNTLTANSGTVTVTGGTGSNKSSDAIYTSYGGGGGSHHLTAGATGTSSTAANAKTGGDGATGVSVIISSNA